MRGRAFAWTVVLTVGSSACHPHVDLRVPPNLTADQRTELFDQRRGTSEKIEWGQHCGVNGCSNYEHHTMYLADGTEVHHVEDIVPAVPADSEAMRHVRAVRAAHSTQWKWVGVAVGGLLVGGYVLLDTAERDASGLENLVMYTSLGAGLVGAFASYYYSRVANAEISQAFHSYNDGLAQTLALCIDGLRVVTCETGTR